MSELERLRERLAIIAQIAGAAGCIGEDAANGANDPEADVPGCVVKQLPSRLIPQSNALQELHMASRKDPDVAAIAVSRGKYWGPSQQEIAVSFLDSNDPAFIREVLRHMNAWNATCGIRFRWSQTGGLVRISTARSGHWSYLGTDIKLIPQNRATMNLQGFTSRTSQSEYLRVVRHETGHTLGCPHEHMRSSLVSRIDPQRAYAWFWSNYGWDRNTVNQQVLTPLDERNLFGTAPDQTSIMCYQFPGSITRDGRPILGGADINSNDYAFMGRIYPKAGNALMDASDADIDSETSMESPAAKQAPATPNDDDWSPDEDVSLDI